MKAEYAEQCFPILREFLGYIEVVKGRSSGTADEYFVDLRTFVRFMKKRKGIVPDSVSMEEIGIEGKKLFQQAGGGELRVLPCLNDAPEWIEALADWVEQNLRGWAERAEPLDIVL